MISAEDAIERIESFRSLEHDWDSYGAEPIPAAVIERAVELVKRYPDNIQFASPYSGGIAVEWAFFNRLSIDVELDGDGNVVMDSMLQIFAYRHHDNVSFSELDQIVPFATGKEEGARNYQANKKRAAARGEDVSKW